MLVRYSPESLKHIPKRIYKTCEKDFYELHPAPQRCSDYAKQLHMRNGLEVLGHELDSPKSRFVVCWTPNAQEVGGTAQAIRLARKYNIPVFNLANPEHLDRILGYIYQHLGDQTMKALKTICYVRSVRNGECTQEIPVKGLLREDGYFVGNDKMSLILSPVIIDFELKGYMTTKEHVVDGVSFVRQWYVNLQYKVLKDLTSTSLIKGANYG